MQAAHTPSIRLLLLDDHVLFREGLSRLLASEPDFELVAQCGTAAEALDALKRAPVDIVLLDYDLENETGTRFISAAHAAGFRGKVLMVTAGMNEMQSALAWKLISHCTACNWNWSESTTSSANSNTCGTI